ncbi:MAG: hypothetical protein ABIA04_06125 [Pseudomonadota bacterium]
MGKTTFALGLLNTFDENHPAYLNWDNLQTRNKLIKGEIPLTLLRDGLQY